VLQGQRLSDFFVINDFSFRHYLRLTTWRPAGGECLPDDPLIQYIWLEIKNNSAINLRAHEALFTVINHRWNRTRNDRLSGKVDECALVGTNDDPRRRRPIRTR